MLERETPQPLVKEDVTKDIRRILKPLFLAAALLVCPGDDIAVIAASVLAPTNIQTMQEYPAIIPERPQIVEEEIDIV